MVPVIAQPAKTAAIKMTKGIAEVLIRNMTKESKEELMPSKLKLPLPPSQSLPRE